MPHFRGIVTLIGRAAPVAVVRHVRRGTTRLAAGLSRIVTGAR